MGIYHWTAIAARGSEGVNVLRLEEQVGHVNVFKIDQANVWTARRFQSNEVYVFQRP